MVGLKRIALSVVILMIFSVNIIFADMPLELIRAFRGDSSNSSLATGCYSPGDLDGDGFSEIFAGELGGEKRVLAFKGGNPPDTIADMIISNNTTLFEWIPDINGDGLTDFSIVGGIIGDNYTRQIWFGGADFYSKTIPDLTFSEASDSLYAYGWEAYSGDINGDSENDLIFTSLGTIPSVSGRYYIYFGGSTIDTIVDLVLTIRGTGSPSYYDFWGSACIGDINNDGYFDLCHRKYRGSDNVSYINILLGSVLTDTVVDYSFATPSFNYWKPGTFGDVIKPLGDINKDGFDDFAVGGATTWPCIFYGGDPFDTIPKILGDTLDELTRGDRIANIGDINHDGWDDIGVGFPAYAFGSGLVYIYFGSYNMDTNPDLIMPYYETWPPVNKDFGGSLGPAGDFNGDGVDDLVVSGRILGIGDRGTIFVYAGDKLLPTSAEDDDDVPIPREYNILNQNYPNPFNNGTIIEYYLRGVFEREIDLSIYNILGQRVRTLYHDLQSGGNHISYWDGKDDFGKDVSSGLYFYRLKTNSEVISKKMIYLK